MLDGLQGGKRERKKPVLLVASLCISDVVDGSTLETLRPSSPITFEEKDSAKRQFWAFDLKIKSTLTICDSITKIKATFKKKK